PIVEETNLKYSIKLTRLLSLSHTHTHARTHARTHAHTYTHTHTEHSDVHSHLLLTRAERAEQDPSTLIHTGTIAPSGTNPPSGTNTLSVQKATLRDWHRWLRGVE